ncbi:GAF domain-containing protein [Paractinoplanes durhamensis]|uniref:GAF domain-containing protein n=1 Tax=Paractinoplanes durhamensis TaxID=113563 RepID=UPI0036263AD6
MTTHEQERIAALHEYRLLDLPAGDELEAVVRVAAQVAGVPNGTLNLIDENRQCQLTSTGFEGGISARSDSMCAVHFEQGEFVYRRDASIDPLFRINPWVTGELGHVRFYASAPLITPQGYALGSLCVFDTEPGDLTAGQVARLQDLALVIVALFERRRQAGSTASSPSSSAPSTPSWNAPTPTWPPPTASCAAPTPSWSSSRPWSATTWPPRSAWSTATSRCSASGTPPTSSRPGGSAPAGARSAGCPG